MEDLRVAYGGEMELLGCHRAMLEQATDRLLKRTVLSAMAAAEGRLEALETIFSYLGREPKRSSDDGASAIARHAHDTIAASSNVRDRDLRVAQAGVRAAHFLDELYGDLIRVGHEHNQPAVVDLLEHARRLDLDAAGGFERSSAVVAARHQRGA